MGELRLLAFHYHLQRGGVTSVLRDGLIALARHGGWDRVVVRILTGSSVGVAPFLRRVRRLAPDRLKVEVEHRPQLGYRTPEWPSKERFQSEAEDLARSLGQAYRAHRADFLWAHNPALGKNPAVTAGLSRFARQPGVRVLYHLHDFAECGRYLNLQRLHRQGLGTTEDLYPVAPGLTLITLTEADRQRLLSAGYPESGVVALPNPVAVRKKPQALSQVERAEVDHLIESWSRQQGFAFSAGGRWLFSPVRTIRRKNVLELALVKLLLGHRWRLLVTLDGSSEPERPYAEYVKECLRREKIEATLGFGGRIRAPRLAFDRLYASAEAVGTTSVLEGFGLVFAESLAFNRPILGRDLPEITQELPGLSREYLYESLRIPLGKADRSSLLGRYQEKTVKLGQAIDLSESHVAQICQRFGKIFDDEWVDFSYLDLPAQARFLHACCVDRSLQGLLRERHPDIERWSEDGFESPSEAQRREMGRFVSLEQFAKRFRRILDSPPSGCSPSASEGVSQRLIEQFFQPPLLRLLLDAGDDWRLWPKQLLPPAGQAGEKAKAAGGPRPLPAAPGVRAVFWDVYGTLLISKVGDLEQRLKAKQSAEPFLEAMQAAGLDVSRQAVDPSAGFQQLIEEDHAAGHRRGQRQPEVVIEEIWRRLIEIVLPGQWASPAQSRFAAAYFEWLTNPVHLRREAAGTLLALETLGFEQGLVSNAQFYTRKILKHLLPSAWNVFAPDLLIWSFETGAAKPDPAPFARAQAALRSRGIEPSEAVLVGDSLENDVLPAKLWGWKAVLLTDSASDDVPDRPSPTGGGEARPDAVCRNLEEVLAWLEGGGRS